MSFDPNEYRKEMMQYSIPHLRKLVRDHRVTDRRHVSIIEGIIEDGERREEADRQKFQDQLEIEKRDIAREANLISKVALTIAALALIVSIVW